MLTQTFRKGSELSDIEKVDIATRMFGAQSRVEKDSVRILLSQQYGITVSSVGALIAHETMRRKKSLEGVGGDSQEGEQSIALIDTEELQSNPTQTVQKSTQARVYTITSLSEITEEMREGIFEEFTAVIQDNISDTRYDFYTDIEAISDYNNIDPNILEQFLRNRYNWLSSRLDELKKGRVIGEEEKMIIRLYVESGVDDKDKKTRRKEMAKKYGVSIYIIGAITAWKLAENGEKMLNKSGSSIEGVPNDAPKGGVTIGETTLPLMQVDSQDAIDGEDDSLESVFSGEDVDFIRELASEFNLNDDSQRTVFLQDIFDLFPDSTIDDIKKILRDFPDDITHTNTKRSGEGMGALVNYNNEIKNKWRQKLKEFIDANTDTEKRKDMKVLCLPGIECLEIPLYLELGFRPENIIGVEAGIVKGKKDPEIIALFQVNASRYGIQTRIGKLEKVLETEDTVFDVVSLDFLGPVNNSANHILEIIKYAYRAIVLTNFQGKREWKQQDVLRHFESKHDGTGKMLHNGGIGYMVEGENSGIELKQTRDGLAIGAFIANATFQRGYATNYGVYREAIPQIVFSIRHLIEKDSPEGIPKKMHCQAMQLFIMNEAYRLAVALTDSLPYKPKDEIVGRIHVFVRSILASTNFVMQHKSYEYKGNNVPMLSDMIVLEGLDVNMFNKKYPELTSFIMKILMYIFSAEGIRGIKFQNIKIGNIKKIGRTIVCGNDGKIVATTNHLKFMNELWEFGKWYNKKNVFASKREQII